MLNPLNKVQNLKDPLKQFVSNWQFSFAAGSKVNELFPSAKIEDLVLRCQSYGFPELVGDDTTVTWGGFKRVYAGKQTRQGSWSVNFIEVWDVEVADGFKKWVDIYHDYKNGKITLLKDYAGTVNIALLEPDVYDSTGPYTSNAGASDPENRFDVRLYDVFPTSVKIDNIDASSSDPIKITAEFNFNYFLMGDEID